MESRTLPLQRGQRLVFERRFISLENKLIGFPQWGHFTGRSLRPNDSVQRPVPAGEARSCGSAAADGWASSLHDLTIVPH